MWEANMSYVVKRCRALGGAGLVRADGEGFAMPGHLASDDGVVDDGERAPLGVVIGTVAGTLALAGMLGVVSVGTMNGMRNNAVDNVRAQIMAGESAPADAGVAEGTDESGTGDGAAQVGHLGGDGPGAVVPQGVPADDGSSSEGGSQGATPASIGVDEVVDSSVSVAGDDGGDGGDGGKVSGTGVVYDVQWGDTLSDISRRFGVSVDEIAAANGLWDPNLIYADSSLQVPGAVRDGGQG